MIQNEIRTLEIKSKYFQFPLGFDELIGIHEIRLNRPFKHTKLRFFYYNAKGYKMTVNISDMWPFHVMRKINYEIFQHPKIIRTSTSFLEIKGFKKGDILTIFFTVANRDEIKLPNNLKQ